MNTQRYVAFLRGINVGAHKMVKMEELRTLFESLGYKNVKTLLNSGNIVFDASKSDMVVLTQDIELSLKKNLDLRFIQLSEALLIFKN